MNTIETTATLHNGVKIPRLGLGTWLTPEGEQVINSVRWALEIGYRHIDTAAIYRNEEGVGRAIRESGIPRERIFVTTKVWNDDIRTGPQAVLRALDASLGRLGLDYVDLYLIHWPVGDFVAAWGVMEQHLDSGKTRAIGVSNFLVHHLEKLLPQARVKPMVNQVEFHPWLVQKPLLEFCRRNQIQHEAWAPVMRGKAGEIPRIVEIARRHGKTPSQVVLRWDLQHGSVTIPKSVRRQRLEENADIFFDFELSEEEMNQIDALDQGRRLGADPDTVSF